MASSKGSPGPHDRKPGTLRAQCIARTRKGERCKRYVTQGAGKLCEFHEEQARLMAAGEERTRGPGRKGGPPNSTPSVSARGGITNYVVNNQAKAALAKIGLEPSPGFDPKTALMATVESAWRQQRVWEAMLASVPEEDFALVGMVPIPGVQDTSRGARIEIIQKNLSESTKNAARISKLAIDAGIEERIVRLAEEQSALIADTVKAAVLAAVGSLAALMHLNPVQVASATDQALGAAAGHLRALAAGGQEIVDSVAVRVGERE